MGACCSRDAYIGEGVVEEAIEDKYHEDDEEDDAIIGDYGARMRLHGASKYISMYTQQGRKGINQDAMTVWEVTYTYIYIIDFVINLSFYLFIFIETCHFIFEYP